MKREWVVAFLILFHSIPLWAANPEADAGPNQNVNEGAIVVLDGSGSTDDDGDIISYQWAQIAGPAVNLSNLGAGPSVTFTAPDVTGDTAFGFRLTVTDSVLGSSSDDIQVTVMDTVVQENRTPTADAGPNQTVNENTTVILDGSNSSDPDGDTLTYRWEQTSGIAVNLSDTSSPSTSFTAPDVNQRADLNFRLTVTDTQGKSDNDTTRVRVTNVPISNRPPVANAGADFSVAQNTDAALHGSASDPDGNAITFFWSQLAGPLVVLSNPSSLSPTFRAPAVKNTTTLRFRLTVQDSRGAVASDDVEVKVTNSLGLSPPPPAPPPKKSESSIEEFRVGPNPFNPNVQSATLRYRLGTDSAVTVSIFDLVGNIVDQFEVVLGGQGGRAGDNVFEWNGRNGRGEAIANGGYIIQITAKDADGNSLFARDKVAVVK